METIKAYIETMFKGVDATSEILDLKEEISSNMQERYEELKKQGKSENESVGTVISEFGNIDELLSEMGYASEILDNDNEEKVPMISREEVLEYVKDSKTLGKRVGLGVAIILCTLAIINLLEGGSELLRWGFGTDRGLLTGIILMAGIIIAVGLFVYFGLKMEKYTMIEKKEVQLDSTTTRFIKEEYKVKREKYIVRHAIGIVLCIAAVIPNMVFSGFSMDDNVGTAIMFFMIAIAVYILIRTGVEQDSYETLIKLQNYHLKGEKGKQAKKCMERIQSIMWPIIIAIYLYLGFVHDMWSRTWVIFALAGVISPAIWCGVNIVVERREEESED